MRHADNMPFILYPIHDFIIQGWIIIRKVEICLKTTLIIGKIIKVREPVGYGNFGKTNH